MGDNKTPSNASRNDSVSEQPAGSRLVHTSAGSMTWSSTLMMRGMTLM